MGVKKEMKWTKISWDEAMLLERLAREKGMTFNQYIMSVMGIDEYIKMCEELEECDNEKQKEEYD